MQKFYIADKEVLKLQITDTAFKAYNYWCSQYNVRTLKPFINYVQTANDLLLPVDRVKKILNDLCSVTVEGDALVSVIDNKALRRLEFDLPRYKTFIKSIGFLGYNSGKGWTNLQQHLKREPEQLNITYKFANLDQYDLYDKLFSLTDAELKQISQKEIKYPWIFTKVMKEKKLGD
tara:strand:+ start:10459 stop:10986 length:528 start_codon:yes stop_codon:yes gene_type:complete